MTCREGTDDTEPSYLELAFGGFTRVQIPIPVALDGDLVELCDMLNDKIAGRQQNASP